MFDIPVYRANINSILQFSKKKINKFERSFYFIVPIDRNEVKI